ncbi:MAG TPA: hypothetical protein VFA04_20620 [Bryobacteraceae bacterium]|nr:hypothetical protein [Bryobacteraceae bacterium]
MYKKILAGSALAVTLGVFPLLAQDSSAPPPPAPTHRWQKFGDPNTPPPDQRAAADPQDGYQQPPDGGQPAPPPPGYGYGQQPPGGYQQPAPPPAGGYQQPAYQQGGRYQAPPPPAYQPPSGPLTIPGGTWVTIRVNQPLSSDHNQVGDAFTGTLVQPLVANGYVLARRGQMVAGRVTEVEKAGHVKGVSHLGIELTEVQLADGRQVPIHTQFVQRQGNTSVGRDAAAIGTTTGLGAAIGAAADGGFGAGMGAIGGAVVSTIGVLATRGRPTVVYPETPITFRLQAPLTVSDDLEAFAPVTQEDYEQGNLRAGPPRPRPYGYPYGPSFYGGYGPYYAYGSWWGPGYYWGPGFYGGFWGPTVVIRGGGHWGHHR